MFSGLIRIYFTSIKFFISGQKFFEIACVRYVVSACWCYGDYVWTAFTALFSNNKLNCGNVCLQYTGNLIFFYSRERSSTALRYEASDPAGRYRVSRNLVRVGIKVSELRTGFRCHSVTLTDFTIASCTSSFRHYYSAVPIYILRYFGASTLFFQT